MYFLTCIFWITSINVFFFFFGILLPFFSFPQLGSTYYFLVHYSVSYEHDKPISKPRKYTIKINIMKPSYSKIKIYILKLVHIKIIDLFTFLSSFYLNTQPSNLFIILSTNKQNTEITLKSLSIIYYFPKKKRSLSIMSVFNVNHT